MNLVSVIFVSVVSLILFSVAAITIIKLFGTGIFYGTGAECVVVIDSHDNVQDRLIMLTDSFGVECESSSAHIIIVDGGMNRGQREVCRRYCDKYSYMIMCTPDNLNETLFSVKKDIMV